MTVKALSVVDIPALGEIIGAAIRRMNTGPKEHEGAPPLSVTASRLEVCQAILDDLAAAGWSLVRA